MMTATPNPYYSNRERRNAAALSRHLSQLPEVLAQIEQRLRDASLSHEGLIHLAKRWSEKLP
jgi:hypothetical protein